MITRQTIAERLTQAIRQQLKNGIIPWRQPWQALAGAVNGETMKPYRGVNQLLLSCHESPSAIFLTYLQGLKLGGFPKKGAKGVPVVFWKMIGTERDGEGHVTERGRPLMKGAHVFALEDFTGIPVDKLPKKPDLQLTMFTPDERADQLLANIKPVPVIRLSGAASYSPTEDLLHMPDMFLFESLQAYYHTLFHELGHWTGHATRLDRFGSKKKSYAYEELVAEMCAAFLCVEARLDPVDEKDDLEQRASYIAGWLSKLKNDPNLLLDATGQAQKAADFILGKVAQDTEIVTAQEQLPLAA